MFGRIVVLDPDAHDSIEERISHFNSIKSIRRRPKKKEYSEGDVSTAAAQAPSPRPLAGYHSLPHHPIHSVPDQKNNTSKKKKKVKKYFIISSEDSTCLHRTLLVNARTACTRCKTIRDNNLLKTPR